MAQIKQVGIGRKSSGTIDGITYVTRNGVTYARSTPTMPASAYNTPEARLRQAVFKMVQMHLKYHLRTIKQTFTAKGNGSPSNRYYATNSKGLTAALTPLAELYNAGQDVTIDDVESAISTYAAEHPKSIKIASKSGYQDVHLTGPWPATITLNANAGDSTVIIIVNEHGQQTTINADGTTVVSGSNTGGNGNSETPGTGGGSDSGNGTSGTDTGGGTNPEPGNDPDTGGGSQGGGNTGGGGDSDEG